MKKHLLLAVGLTVVLVMVGLCGCGTVPTTATIEGISLTSQQEGIWVSGQGKVTVVPDIATLRLGVEAQQASVAEAKSQASEAMNRVMDALTDNGVAKKDIQTQYFSIHQVTRWDNEKQQEIVIGYRVSNIVTAKVRDIDKVGVIIDAVAEAGGDLQEERTAQRLNTCLMMVASLLSVQEAGGEEVALAPAPRTPALETVPEESAPEARTRGEGGGSKRIAKLAQLRNKMSRSATDHPAALRAMLRKAPESARPALLRAIAISEAGYEKALRALD